MRICALDLHHKSAYLMHMLQERGFEFSPYADFFDYELLLVDTDHPLSPPVPLKHNIVKECVKKGIPVVIYPHGGPPDLDLDGLRKSNIPVSCQLAHGEGHAEINRRFGCARRIEVVGWMFGPVAPRSPHVLSSPGPNIESILFAPIHPWADGKGILPPHRALNQRAYKAFLEHPAERKVVRMFGEDAPNGVFERVDGVEYTQSDLSAVTVFNLVQQFDAIISYGTLAYIALSLGKPVAMIYGYPPHASDDGKVEAAHFSEYADYTRYPASVGDAPLDDLFAMDVSEWKRLFVGEQLDMDKLEAVLTGLRPNRATRRKLAKV